jgi:hypothetical protein
MEANSATQSFFRLALFHDRPRSQPLGTLYPFRKRISRLTSTRIMKQAWRFCKHLGANQNPTAAAAPADPNAAARADPNAAAPTDTNAAAPGAMAAVSRNTGYHDDSLAPCSRPFALRILLPLIEGERESILRVH